VQESLLGVVNGHLYWYAHLLTGARSLETTHALAIVCELVLGCQAYLSTSTQAGRVGCRHPEQLMMMQSMQCLW
jgi:hypothetical protein